MNQITIYSAMMKRANDGHAEIKKYWDDVDSGANEISAFADSQMKADPLTDVRYANYKLTDMKGDDNSPAATLRRGAESGAKIDLKSSHGFNRSAIVQKAKELGLDLTDTDIDYITSAADRSGAVNKLKFLNMPFPNDTAGKGNLPTQEVMKWMRRGLPRRGTKQRFDNDSWGTPEKREKLEQLMLWVFRNSKLWAKSGNPAVSGNVQ